MPKSATYFVTYYKNQDAKRHLKSGKPLPAYTDSVKALSEEHARKLLSRRGYTIHSVVKRGRGSLPKFPEWLTLEKPVEQPTASAPESAPEPEVTGSVEVSASEPLTPTFDYFLVTDTVLTPLQVDQVIHHFFPDPATETTAVVEDPDAADAANAAESSPADNPDFLREEFSNVKIPRTDLEPGVATFPAPSPEETAVLTQRSEEEFEAEKRNAIENLDILIESRETELEGLKHDLSLCVNHSANSIEHYDVMENEALVADVRVNVRPLAVSLYAAEFGELPEAIPEEHPTVQNDLQQLASNIENQHASDLANHTRVEQIQSDIEECETELYALRYLRSELTGEPFFEEEPESGGVEAAELAKHEALDEWRKAELKNKLRELIYALLAIAVTAFLGFLLINKTLPAFFVPFEALAMAIAGVKLGRLYERMGDYHYNFSFEDGKFSVNGDPQ